MPMQTFPVNPHKTMVKHIFPLQPVSGQTSTLQPMEDWTGADTNNVVCGRQMLEKFVPEAHTTEKMNSRAILKELYMRNPCWSSL